MNIKITTEQFNLIQEEIIKLENHMSDNSDKISGWDYGWLRAEIDMLKGILKTETIDLIELVQGI